MGVFYTPGQVQKLVSISPETYRHWRKSLVPLESHKGHSPSFSPGDLIAVLVVRVCVDMGVQVRAISPFAEGLFSICNSVPWPSLERGKLVFEINNGVVRLDQELAHITDGGPHLVIPMRQIVSALRDQLLAVQGIDAQQALQFPPTPVSATGAAGKLRGQA